MATNVVGLEARAYQDVLGAKAAAVERAVIAKEITGEEDLNQVVARMCRLLGASKGDVYALLGVTSSRVSRNARMDVDVLDRAGSALKVYARVAAVLGGERASAWFGRSNPHLGGSRPIELLRSGLGRSRLMSLVTSLEDGSFL